MICSRSEHFKISIIMKMELTEVKAVFTYILILISQRQVKSYLWTSKWPLEAVGGKRVRKKDKG